MTRSLRHAYLLAGVVVAGLLLLLTFGSVQAAGAAETTARDDAVEAAVDSASVVADDTRVVEERAAAQDEVSGSELHVTAITALAAIVAGFVGRLVVRAGVGPALWVVRSWQDTRAIP
jgi:hypothetical protein